MLNNKIIKRNSPIIGVLLMSALSQLTHAETGNYFMHKDWELACDNTGMCARWVIKVMLSLVIQFHY